VPGATQPGLPARHEPEETEERAMTAATGKGANGGHVARAQYTDPPRTAGRSRTSGRPEAPGRLKPGDHPEAASHASGVERISVALIPKVVDALLRLQARTNLSKTDLVNRALTLLDFFEAQLDSDRDILIRDKVTQEIQSIMLL
jgi:hypothetical protein